MLDGVRRLHALLLSSYGQIKGIVCFFPMSNIIASEMSIVFLTM